jgi:shikimate kinase
VYDADDWVSILPTNERSMTRDLQPTDLLRGTNLYLVGMMGAGKSTLGHHLAGHLGYRFLDTDALIEQVAGQPIAEIFASVGEADFRTLETEVLAQVSAYTRVVIATGGGIVLQPMNWSYLRHGVVVWLDVPLPELESRLQDDRDRPLLQRPDWKTHLATLLAQRHPLYAAADIHLPVAPGEPPAAIAQRLFGLMQTRLRPAPMPSPQSTPANP